ncbi:MAG TPA: coproporphyrinogen-III oxidase family protein, partial [Acidimicrobiales bacterium]|nr:coproporphyrinogen-III oxidase family protein [Acidimicrobiales bacterium]
GGGTPSRLPPDLLAMVLDAVERRPGCEVTVECNPEDASPGRMAAWRAAGVTRVSLGVQSMVPRVLESLGRRHGTTEVAGAVARIGAAGFASVGVDLIIGAAAEADADLEATVAAVLALDPRPDHVSAYGLTVEPGTALWRDPARHPDEDAVARRYGRLDAALADAGYRWYEVSNWARPGHECRHNALYWAQGDYRGIGCAAHSHHGGRRFWNVRSPERYIAAVAAGRSPCAGEEVLGRAERAFEALALALRTTRGVPWSVVPDDPALDGLLERRGDRAVLSVRGRLLANEVTVRLRVPGGHGPDPAPGPRPAPARR